MAKKFVLTGALPEPEWTQVANKFFEMLPEMEASEARVTLIMIRETYGYHRESFKMGLGKLAEAAGLSRNAAKDGAESAEERGTFRRSNPDEQTEAEWELIVGQPLTPVTECIPPMQPLTTPHATIDSQVWIKESIKENKEAANAAKPDLLDAEIHFNLKPTSIREAVKAHFRLNVNWDTKLARQWMEWAVGENVTAEQIEAAAQLWRSDKAFNWQVPTLKGIFEKWPMLNADKKESRSFGL